MRNLFAGQVDVLNLEWTANNGRDRTMATLVCNYLRLQGLNVVEDAVYDGMHALASVRPRLFFISNSVGAIENLELMRYAKRRGMLAVSLLSEGAFMGDTTYLNQLIWGWNKERKLYEDLHLQWSAFTRNITIGMYPELADRIKVSGGVGFDNYQIAPALGVKNKLLSKYAKNGYSRVVGVGCWNFGLFYPEDSRFKINRELYQGADAERFRQDGIDFDRVLEELANANKDILFLLKEHPGVELGHMGSGIERVAQCANVLILKNEESILDCIQASDLWVVYESTTSIEAWLLGKPTCLLNPSGRDFPRDRLNEGSPAFSSAVQMQEFINAHYAGLESPDFSARAPIRKQLITKIIQWDDGLNHVRAGNEILDLLEASAGSNWRRESLTEILSRWWQHWKWELGPYLRKSQEFCQSAADRRNFSFVDLAQYSDAKLHEQMSFYRARGLSLSDLRQVRCL